MNHRPLIIPYNGVYPKIAKDAFIAPNAVIIGDVTIGSKSSIWFGCVVRGDVARITIGEETNIQDGSVIHVTRNGVDTIIGSGVTIGHKVLLHGCMINDGAFIGMGSTLMDRSIVESGSMVAAGSLVSGKKIIKTGEVWAGNPAKFFRAIKEEELSHIPVSAANYVKHAEEYLAMKF
ncbi:Carnitine operon protein CaiE [Candidatus Arcanobacter lacustris]|uniref:Carnitine operon protein CaiE n=1 Tax=Candidatus Arcanibacter lacustris TaxID=1607817 RepID=A0A0F5MNZ0_9RICK|nr:Carnitine operon protein CaiE [Candidatus Arcanobacter lacustris]